VVGDFNDKIGRGNIFKLTIENESLHEISNDNVVRVVNFSTSKIELSAVQCFQSAALVNSLGHFLMERHAVKFISV
jgi:hypothetical protein